MENIEPNPDLIPYLPESLRVMLDIIPLDAVLSLVRHCGGTEIIVPQDITEESGLAKAIGFDNARRFVWHYQSEHLYIPTAHRLRRYVETQKRNQAVVKAFAAGIDRTVIARTHQISVRWVYLIVKHHRRQRRGASDSMPSPT